MLSLTGNWVLLNGLWKSVAIKYQQILGTLSYSSMVNNKKCGTSWSRIALPYMASWWKD